MSYEKRTEKQKSLKQVGFGGKKDAYLGARKGPNYKHIQKI